MNNQRNASFRNSQTTSVIAAIVFIPMLITWYGMHNYHNDAMYDIQSCIDNGGTTQRCFSYYQ